MFIYLGGDIMVVLDKFEDVVLLMNNRGNVIINLEKMDSDNYLKSVDFISRFKGVFKRLSRSTFAFYYG